MADYQAGKRYAQAVFAIANEGGTVDQWRADLGDIAAVFAESDAAPLFADDRIPVERRQAMAEQVLDVSALALNLAKLLIAKSRTADARAIADAFGRYADEGAGIVAADITTAVPLTAEKVAAMEQQLSVSLGKSVRATAYVDPAIIGGIIIRIGDRLIDGSVRTRLKELRRDLVGAR